MEILSIIKSKTQILKKCPNGQICFVECFMRLESVLDANLDGISLVECGP